MAPNDKVSYGDLQSMKNEITKEQTEYRHDDRRKMQEVVVLVDDIKEETSLLKQSYAFMSKDITEIKQIVKDGFKEMNTKFDQQNTKFDELPKEFVRRSEHDINKEKIAKIEEVLSWTAKIIIGAVILALLGLVIAKTGVTAP